ncbi:MAG TPA: glycosyltransferase [Vicinamibacterales bacterium]
MRVTHPRIAYVDVNVRYLNRSREKCIEALEQTGEVIKIGPGFSAPHESCRVLEQLLQSGAIDVLVTTPHIALASSFEGVGTAEIAALYRKSFGYTFDDSEFSQLAVLNRQLQQTRIPRLVFLLEADYYNFTADRIAAFCSVGDVLLGFGPESWGRKVDMRHLAAESFAPLVNDCWVEFLETNGHRVASFHHPIGDDEFCSIPLAERPKAWSVLGVRYEARRVAISTLRRHGVSPVVSGPLRRAFSLLRRLRLARGETAASINRVQQEFRNKLVRSRYSFACGSGIEMPVRKFFEIPAAGSVLVCRTFRAAGALGFKNGENYIECEPQDIMDVHRFLERNPEKAQEIADAGRRLIAERHSVAARAAQLRTIYASVLADHPRWKTARS